MKKITEYPVCLGFNVVSGKLSRGQSLNSCWKLSHWSPTPVIRVVIVSELSGNNLIQNTEYNQLPPVTEWKIMTDKPALGSGSFLIDQSVSQSVEWLWLYILTFTYSCREILLLVDWGLRTQTFLVIFRTFMIGRPMKHSLEKLTWDFWSEFPNWRTALPREWCDWPGLWCDNNIRPEEFPY